MKILFQSDSDQQSIRVWLIIGLACLMFFFGAYIINSNELTLNLILMIAGFMSGLIIYDSLTHGFDKLDDDERRIALFSISDLMSDENFDYIPDDIVSILESRMNAIEDELNIMRENIDTNTTCANVLADTLVTVKDDIRNNKQLIDNIQNP